MNTKTPGHLDRVTDRKAPAMAQHEMTDTPTTTAPLAPWWVRALLTAIDAAHPRTAWAMLDVDHDPYAVSRVR